MRRGRVPHSVTFMTRIRAAPRSRTFLVESYAPGSSDHDLAVASDRVRLATQASRDSGGHVAYIGALSLPRDEVVFHLFASREVAPVRDICQRASITVERIVESIVIAADPDMVMPGVRPMAQDRARGNRR